MATAEFSKCAGILSAALSQHHLSRFEIAQPHIQGAMAVRAQEGPEELCHVEGQEGWQ